MRKETKNIAARRITRLALLTAAALILTLVENMLAPLLNLIPGFAFGVRMGLPNLAVLAALVLFGPIDMIAVLAAKCLLGALFAGSPTALMYSVPAGFFSFGIQYPLYKFVFPKISLISISLAGAIVHNVVQLAVASLVVGQDLFVLFPIMLIASFIAGLFIGLVVFFTVKYFPKKLL